MQPAFRILGPLEVDMGEHVVALGRRERALLGVLLLNTGVVVSVERLIDGVWGEAPPSSAKHMVHEYVSRLRTALGDSARIETRAPGYVARCADEELDAHLFAQRATAARASASAGGHAEALRLYDEALALWRGDALAGVELEGEAQIDVARLDQERRLVAEERLDSALALGHHAQLIPELERRVRDAPLRERARGQLMLALYRDGRQVDALERYREGRAALVEHAGVEPGPELRRLERAILTQDPALDLAPVVSTRAGTASATGAGRRWKRAAGAGAGALVVVAAAGVILIAGHSESAHALERIDASSAGAIDPGSNRLVQEVRIGAGPGRAASGFGSLWVVNDFDNNVSRIDPASGTVEQTITVDSDPTAIAVAGEYVWVASTGSSRVDLINPQVNRVVDSVPVGNGPSGIATSPGTVWVTNRLDDSVTGIDARTGDVRGTFEAGPGPSDIAYGRGALWIANESSSTVTRFDPVSHGLQTIPVGNGPDAVTVAYGSIWVANSLDGTVSRINPSNHAVTGLEVGSGPTSILASAGAIWVADSYAGRVVRIDPANNTIVRTIRLGSGPQSLAALDGRIWLSTRENAASHRGGTLRLFDFVLPDSLDEATGVISESQSIFTTTGDGVIGFRRVDGLDGTTPVPDLARAISPPTDGGLTYTFQLRRGIRYSNGDPLRASDLRRALERDFRIGALGRTYFSDLLGSEACSKARCDLSRGVVTNDHTGTITLHLHKPDPEFLSKLAVPAAYPVPREVSMTRSERLGVPGTGPYLVERYETKSKKTGRLVLVRNPHFRAWSAAAQPAGYPDRIVLTYNEQRSRQLTAVEHGQADVVNSPPPARLHEIATRYAAQVHIFPQSRTFAIYFNTRVPPFNSLAARRAVDYAIDRSKAVAGFSGGDGAAATCQILPPGSTGYRPYCPYTLNPGGGSWSAPDLARARKLVAASGTYGQTVVFWTGDKPFQLEVGKLALATLKSLGYDAKLKILRKDTYFAAANDSRTRIQTGFYAWGADFPSAAGYLGPLFTCKALQLASKNNENASLFCDSRVERAFDRALAGESTAAPSASSAAWSAVDRAITDLAPWAPLVNQRVFVVVSRRVGNVQSSPVWGLIYDQMWVK